MRILISIFLLAFTLPCFAQELDFSDFRRKNEGFAHVTDKNIRNDLSCFTLGGLDESIGKGQLKKIPVSSYGNDYISYDSNKVHITIKSAPFFVTKHKITKEGDHVVKIDGKAYMGNYGKMPIIGIGSITVLIDGDTVSIPESAWSGLYNPQFYYQEGNVMKTKSAVYLSQDKHTIYIYMLNSDPQGGYEVTWVIQDKKFIRRVVDYGFN